jgi:hypothetical protein
MSKDVRIRGYFSKSKGARERKNLGNTDLENTVNLVGHLENTWCDVIHKQPYQSLHVQCKNA